MFVCERTIYFCHWASKYSKNVDEVPLSRLMNLLLKHLDSYAQWRFSIPPPRIISLDAAHMVVLMYAIHPAMIIVIRRWILNRVWRERKRVREEAMMKVRKKANNWQAYWIYSSVVCCFLLSLLAHVEYNSFFFGTHFSARNDDFLWKKETLPITSIAGCDFVELHFFIRWRVLLFNF
jgi:hypothetical protein